MSKFQIFSQKRHYSVDLPQLIFNNKINGGKQTLIYTNDSLAVHYRNYSNINQKISLETRKGNLTRIKRGLYTDNLDQDAPIIANICYSPSYLSFEYALSFHGLIPEYVSTYTSAVFGKKNSKRYRTDDAIFEYRSIPDRVFPEGILFLKNSNDMYYKIATKEKALCDTLYSKYPVRSLAALNILLFEDMRIDENEFSALDFDLIAQIAPGYHSSTLSMLQKLIQESER